MLDAPKGQGFRIKHIFLISLCLIFHNHYGQNTVGIGTKTPNPHAVLDLSSPTYNQGFLAPRLTTIQRTAPGFISILTSEDNGLLVFDTTLNKFFFWNDTHWDELTNGESHAGLPGPKGDPGPPGEKGEAGTSNIQMAGDGLVLTSSTISANVDDVTLGVNVSNQLELKDKSVSSAKLADLSVEDTKIASISPSKILADGASSGEVLKWNGTHWTPSEDKKSDADSSAENEIQDLSLTNNSLSISRNSLATVIDLSPYLDNTDHQTLSFNPSNGQLTITNQPSPVQLTVSGDVTGSLNNVTVSKIQSRAVSAAAPTIGDILKWNGSQWVPSKDEGSPTSNGSNMNGGLNFGETAPPVALRKDGMLWLETAVGGNGRDSTLWIWQSSTSSWIEVTSFHGR